MAALTSIIAAAGLAISAVGAVVQMDAANKQAQASQRAEALRKQQMELESTRQRRQILRNAIKARSLALSGAVYSGASSGSGLQGGFGQIGSQAARNIQGVNQAEEIGAGIFQANSDIAGAQSLASFGGGLSSLGGAVFSGSESLGRVGNFVLRNGE